MKKQVLAFSFVLLGFSQNLFAHGLKNENIFQVIYGADNRLDIVKSTPARALLAKSTAGMIHISQLDKFKDSFYYLLETPDYHESSSVCEEESYSNQIVAPSCSGFLVAPDVLVTAGHCVQKQIDCQDYKWVFDFNQKIDGSIKTNFPLNDVYFCKEIISRVRDPQTLLDYSVIRLDRKVEGRAALKFRTEGKVADDAELMVIGHPSGLPTKIADQGKIRQNDNPYFFTADIDTFGGNSGSAVFDANTGLVEGILVRGESDFIYDTERKCMTIKKCAEGTCRGEDIVRITQIADIIKMAN